jgi:hypothetical protein
MALRKLIRSVAAEGFWSGEANAVTGCSRAQQRRYRRPSRADGIDF